MVARGVAAALVLLAELGVAGAWFSHRVAADQPGITEVARVPLPDSYIPASNDVLIDAGARRVIMWTTQPPQELVAYDLDTFRQVAQVKDDLTDMGSHAPSFPASLDAQRHILFHEEHNPNTLTYDVYGIDTRTLATVLKFSLPAYVQDSYAGLYWSARDRLLYSVWAMSPLQNRQGVSFLAMDPYAPGGGTVLWHTPPVRGCTFTFTNNETAPVGETSDGRYLVTVCQTGQTTGAAVVRLALPGGAPVPGSLWTGTTDLYPGLSPGGVALAQWIPGTDRMAAMVTTSSGWAAYVWDAVSLRYVAAPALFIPPHGSNLLYNEINFGTDPATGRLFAQSFAMSTYGRSQSGSPCQAVVPGSNSVALVETSLSGVATLHFPGGADDMVGPEHLVAYDPVGRNWLMFQTHVTWPPPCSGQGPQYAEAYLAAYHDSVPAAVTPPQPNVDAATANIPEASGMTGSQASSDGSAYGERYVVGPSGVSGLSSTGSDMCDVAAMYSQETATSPLPPPAGAPPLPPQFHAFCNADNRVATFAHVDKVLLDRSEARADAITGDTDRETARDLELGTDMSHPVPYIEAVHGYVNAVPGSLVASAPSIIDPCPPPGPTQCDQAIAPAQPYLSGLALPYVPAQCGDDGGGVAQGGAAAPLQVHGLPAGSPASYPGSASVYCAFALQRASGHAEQVSATVAGPLDMPVAARGASSDVSVAQTGSAGSTATATATVHDISIAGVLHIASLTATATVAAHGRPHTNPATYTCTVTGIEVPPSVALPPGVPSSIPSASCNDTRVTALTDALNTLFAGTLRIEFPAAPTPEDRPAGGDAAVVQRHSPGGYLSEVAISDDDQAQNAILMNDGSIEQPGLVVTVYLDSSQHRNRVVASFAAVAATARYGIFHLDNGSGDTGGDGDTGAAGVATGAFPLPSGAPEMGVPPLVPPVAPRPAPPAATPGWSAIPAAVIDGLRMLLQHPQMIAPLLATWLLFLGPAYLLSRRRALLGAT